MTAKPAAATGWPSTPWCRSIPIGCTGPCAINRISMCGVLPAVVVLSALRGLNALNRCHEVGYTTSAAVSHDTQRCVGYAGMLFA